MDKKNKYRERKREKERERKREGQRERQRQRQRERDREPVCAIYAVCTGITAPAFEPRRALTDTSKWVTERLPITPTHSSTAGTIAIRRTC